MSIYDRNKLFYWFLRAKCGKNRRNKYSKVEGRNWIWNPVSHSLPGVHPGNSLPTNQSVVSNSCCNWSLRRQQPSLPHSCLTLPSPLFSSTLAREFQRLSVKFFLFELMRWGLDLSHPRRHHRHLHFHPCQTDQLLHWLCQRCQEFRLMLSLSGEHFRALRLFPNFYSTD